MSVLVPLAVMLLAVALQRLESGLLGGSRAAPVRSETAARMEDGRTRATMRTAARDLASAASRRTYPGESWGDRSADRRYQPLGAAR